MVLYIGYLVQMGLALIMLPWVPMWSILLLEMPLDVAFVLHAPLTRGLVSAFGLLHLLMVALEFLHAGKRSRGLPQKQSSAQSIVG